MKTNINAVSKVITLLLAAMALAFTAHSTWAKDQVPFQGSAEGAIVSVSPNPAGVVLAVLAEGNATHLGRFSREETILFNPVTGALTGLTVREAVRKGADVQMRPILMATLGAAIGLLPAALATGIGSQAQKPLALVVVGGMLTAAVLILVVLPVLYEIVHHCSVNNGGEEKR